MATPQEILEAIEYSVEESGDFSDELSWSLQEVDEAGRDSDIRLPLAEVEIAPSQERINLFNTDFARYKTDDNGNQVGQVYQMEYELGIELDIWTADGSSSDVMDLAAETQRALAEYDSAGLNNPLLHPDMGELESVWRFLVGDGERVDDVSYSPTLRRWRQSIEVWSYIEYDTTDDYIVDFTLVEPDTVVLPRDETTEDN